LGSQEETQEETMSNYIRTDEKQNAFDSLEKTTFFLERTKKDSSWWKWATIALHSALYGFMVCALRGSAGFSTYPDYIEERLLRFYSLSPEEQKKQSHPIVKLDYFLSLYEKIQDPKHMATTTQSRTFAPQGNLAWSVNRLHELRNEFMHFTPKGLSLEISGMPQIVEDVKGIIWFLIFDSNNIILDDGQQRAAEEMLTKLSQRAKAITVSLTANQSGHQNVPVLGSKGVVGHDG
jgi:hypothetical protein